MRAASESPSTTLYLKSYALLIFLSLMWGTSYILIKKALGVFDPIQVGLLRLSISALAFLPFLLLRLRKIPRDRIGFLLLVGLTGTGLPSLLFPLAQTHISSSAAGILNSLTPLFTLILGMLLFRAPLIWAKVLGIMIGLGGAALLIIQGQDGATGSNGWYGLLIVAATLCYATSTNVVGYSLRDLSPTLISAASFAMVGLPALLFVCFSDIPHVLYTHPGAWGALSIIGILALGSTVLASILFFQLIHWTGPVFSSTVSYLVPAVALLWGMLDGESISPFHFLGMGLILTGVYLSRKK